MLQINDHGMPLTRVVQRGVQNLFYLTFVNYGVWWVKGLRLSLSKGPFIHSQWATSAHWIISKFQLCYLEKKRRKISSDHELRFQGHGLLHEGQGLIPGWPSLELLNLNPVWCFIQRQNDIYRRAAYFIEFFFSEFNKI